MAGYSARQSTYTTGDTISAADTNDEFDTILTAFGTSGHIHDGTAGNGAAITSFPSNVTIKDDVKLYFGTGSDAYIEYDEDGTDTWDFSPPAAGMKILDDKKLVFGTGSDISILYDETTTDSLRITAAEGAGLAITLGADEGDDAGDEWKVNIADGGVMTWGNDKNSAGTYVTHVTLTPHATVASSTVAFAGGVTVAGDLTVSGDDITMGTNTSGYIMVADGTNFNPVVVSGDVTMASNGAVTIASQAVENSMLADDAVGADELAANAVVNASVASGAAIAFSKMADLTASRALVSDGSGDVSVSSVTSTELGYLDISTLGTSEASKAVTVDSNGDLLVPDSDKYKFGASSDMQIYHDGTNSYITNSQGALKIATESSGIAITIGHGTSEVTVSDNLTVTGDFTVSGTTTTLNTTNLTVGDTLIKLNQGYVGSAQDQGIVFTRGDGSGSNTQNMAFIWDESADTFSTIKSATEDGTTAGNVTVTDYVNLRVGALTADDNSTFTGNVTAANVVVANDGDVGSAGATDAMQISSAGIVTFKDDIKIKDGGTIGTATTPGAMTVASGGAVTFSAVPLFPNDTIETADIQADAITGAKIADDAIDSEHYTDGSIDLAHVATAAKTECIAIACSDETTALATATAQATFHMPYAFYLTGVKASLTTAPVGSVFTVDINEAGSTILTTKLTIDAAEKTSGTAATAAVIGGAGPALADNALMTVDIDGIGSSTAGTGLKVYLIGYQT
jgi:hypothetical protein